MTPSKRVHVRNFCFHVGGLVTCCVLFVLSDARHPRSAKPNQFLSQMSFRGTFGTLRLEVTERLVTCNIQPPTSDWSFRSDPVCSPFSLFLGNVAGFVFIMAGGLQVLAAAHLVGKQNLALTGVIW